MASDESGSMANELSSRPGGNHISLTTPSSSFNRNSSSSSLGESRSPSPGSSNTSQSISPSPSRRSIHQNEPIPSIELSDFSVPDVPHPLPVPTPATTPNQDEPPRSVPPEANSAANDESDRSFLTRAHSRLHGRPWSSNGINLTMLLVSAVGLLFFGWRTYRLEVVSTINSYVQNCFSQREVSEGAVFLLMG